MNILLVIGIVIILGAAGGKLFQKLRLPSIMGYILIGVLLGESFDGILSGAILNSFVPIVNLALGIIGFMIGTELNLERFKRYSRSIYTILFFETIATFIFVAAAVTLITGKPYLGILLGAVSSATAPAATYNVLGEYKARGPLTMTTLSIVALDDGLALILYGLASAFAKVLIMHEKVSLVATLAVPIYEIFVSVALGAAAAFLLARIFKMARDADQVLPYSIGLIILLVGLSIFLRVDFILASMVFGAFVANMKTFENIDLFGSIRRLSQPIYILFFVLVGARLDARILMMGSVLALAVIYILARSAGKFAGSYLGGKISRARETVTKYLGFCLFDQAGVAVGLSIAAYNLLARAGLEDQGLLVINLVTATTFLLQIVAPPMIKLGVKKADEINRNVTEDDIIKGYKVRDVMEKEVAKIAVNRNLHQILEIMKESDGLYFPIVGLDGRFRGVTSIGEIRDTFYEEQMSELIVAEDILRETTTVVYKDQELVEAVDVFKKSRVDYLPVLDTKESQVLVGQLEYKKLMEKVSKEAVLRQQELEA